MTKSRLQIAACFAAVALTAYIFVPSFSDRPSSPHTQTTGLVNTGNDCYANATFQALAALDGLIEWLSSREKDPWTAAMLAQLVSLREESHTSKHTESIWPLLRVMEKQLHARLNRGQQDAHEMLVEVIDLMNGGDGTPNPFLGEMTDTITCLSCSASKKNRYASFAIERQPDEPILETQVDRILGYKCESCHREVAIEKRTQLTTFPQLLAVHVNRSVYRGQSFRNTSETAIPLTIGTYKLRSVIFHKGHHSAGHYTCARRKIARGPGKQWWLISDDSIKEASDEQVIRRKGDAYIMLFEKQDIRSLLAQQTSAQDKTRPEGARPNTDKPSLSDGSPTQNELAKQDGPNEPASKVALKNEVRKK